jgi:hypothetical protein
MMLDVKNLFVNISVNAFFGKISAYIIGIKLDNNAIQEVTNIHSIV